MTEQAESIMHYGALSIVGCDNPEWSVYGEQNPVAWQSMCTSPMCVCVDLSGTSTQNFARQKVYTFAHAGPIWSCKALCENVHVAKKRRDTIHTLTCVCVWSCTWSSNSALSFSQAARGKMSFFTWRGGLFLLALHCTKLHLLRRDAYKWQKIRHFDFFLFSFGITISQLFAIISQLVECFNDSLFQTFISSKRFYWIHGLHWQGVV